MKKRPHINLTTKLAAALLTIVRPDEHGVLCRVISHAEAKTLTARAILARFEWDHYPVRFADGGCSEPWNLEPRPIIEHRTKTAKKDAPEMKKARRIANRRADDLARVEVRGAMGEAVEGCGPCCSMTRCARSLDGRCSRLKPKRKWPSRPFPKRPKKTRRNAR